ncbi:MAG: NADH dehydrogenase subunit, partial [Candidatus Bathyarchaeia archaeon]
IYYIKSNGTNIPERVKVRTPSYANNFAILAMLRGEYLKNARAVIESIDPCFACTDRVVVVDARTGVRRIMNLK